MADPIVPVSPFLPLATQVYDPRNIEQILRVLRLYFQQVDSFNQTVLSIIGNVNCGGFYDTTNQYAAVANTAYAVTFNNTDTTVTSNAYLGTPTSRVYVKKTGIYNIQFSAQLLTNAGGTHLAYIWFRKNGTNVADSTTKMTIQGNNTAEVAAWNFALALEAGDYFELMWESNDTHIYLLAEAGSAVHPAIPSVILTVTKFNN